MKIAKQSVELLETMGSDLSVVNAARVSFHKESTLEYDLWIGDRPQGEGSLSEKDQKLIGYLANHNHWSPFAHTSLQFRIKAPIFVARQLVKHQVGGVWNEVSRRYVDDEPEFYFPDVWRGKPVNAKQGSDGEVDIYLCRGMGPEEATQDSLNAYMTMLEIGVAPEQARMILPQNTMTEWIWTGSLMFFARVCKQRLDSHAQAETREIAQMINDQIPEEFQHSWKALMA
jgi:thymidylate synthase (FAD)